MRYVIRADAPSGLQSQLLARTDWEGTAYLMARDILAPNFGPLWTIVVVDTRKRNAILYRLPGTTFGIDANLTHGG